MNISHLIKQKSYEKIEFLLHRHSITFLPQIILFIILMAVPPAIYFLLQNLFPTLLQNAILFPAGVIIASIFYLSVYLFFYALFIDFYLDMWIITNDRIVDMEQKGLFVRVVTEMDLYRIQDVTVSVSGFFPTILNYGDVRVQTAAANVDVVFYNIPRPNEIRQTLLHLAEEDRRFHHTN